MLEIKITSPYRKHHLVIESLKYELHRNNSLLHLKRLKTLPLINNNFKNASIQESNSLSKRKSKHNLYNHQLIKVMKQESS
jgi:hypothetical protein